MRKLSPARYALLKKLAGTTRPLMWTADEPSEWWIEGEDTLLHPATCNWLIRNKMMAYDVLLNDGADGKSLSQHTDRMLGYRGIAYTITEAGFSALKLSGPKAKILPFKSAPAARCSLPSGESDPLVTLDYAGGDDRSVRIIVGDKDRESSIDGPRTTASLSPQ